MFKSELTCLLLKKHNKHCSKKSILTYSLCMEITTPEQMQCMYLIQKRHCMEINSEDSCKEKRCATSKFLKQPAFSSKEVNIYICRKLKQ